MRRMMMKSVWFLGLMSALLLFSPMEAAAKGGGHSRHKSHYRSSHSDDRHRGEDHAGYRYESRHHRHYSYGRHGRRSYYRYRHHVPYGQFVLSIPIGHVVVHFGNVDYYYHEGVYYHYDRRGYRVVGPPVGVVVPVLPHDYIEVTLDGDDCFWSKGVYYRPHVHSGGVSYVVLKVD